jgi:hypothetical protein
LSEDVNTNTKIIELNNKLETELNRWTMMGVDPNQVIQFNPTKIDIWVQTLTKFLSSKGVIDEEEFVIYFKEQMLETLSKIRIEVVEPELGKKIHLPNKGMFN